MNRKILLTCFNKVVSVNDGFLRNKLASIYNWSKKEADGKKSFCTQLKEGSWKFIIDCKNLLLQTNIFINEL